MDVIGLGALNVDLIATTSVVQDVPVEDGETLTTRQEIQARLDAENLAPEAFLGGSAFNAMVMLAQLRSSLRLGMIGISAAAANGLDESHSDRLKALQIVDVTRPSGQRPGLCLALSTEHGRRLFTAPEANLEIADYLRSDDRPRAAVRSARILHLTSLLEDPSIPGSNDVAKSVASFVEAVKGDNPDLVLSFDPGRTWVDGVGPLPDLRRIYALADVLYINPHEYEVLSRGHDNRGGGSPRSLRGLCSASTLMIIKPKREIVVQRSNGLELARVPRMDDAAAVDPTGAGDAVAAGVLAALGQARSVVEGCQLGLRIAARRVSDFGDRGHVDLRGALGRLWL